MNLSTSLATAVLVGVAFTGSACTTRSADDAKSDAGVALDETKAGASNAIDAAKKAGSEAMDASRDAAHVAADKTKDIAGAIGEKGKDVALATGASITDGWVTAKVKAKFADETALNGSDINVDTTSLTVTLNGYVRSGAARARAEAIVAGTEGVKHVVNHLVVRE